MKLWAEKNIQKKKYKEKRVNTCDMMLIAVWESVFILNVLCDRVAKRAVHIAAISAFVEDGQLLLFVISEIKAFKKR